MKAATSTTDEAETAMRTGELARRAGVNVETLRYYERRGLLPEPARRPSGHREYPLEALERMRAIKRAQRLGFTLAEIERLLGPRGRRPALDVQATAAAKLVELEERLQDMQDMRAELRVLVDLDCDALVGCKCERAECPVAHDDRVARAESTAVEGDEWADRAPERSAAERVPATTRRAWPGAIAVTVACLVCVLPVLGIGALTAVVTGSSLGWEAIERVGLVVAAVVATSLAMAHRAARSGSRCGRCAPASHAAGG